MEKSTLLKKWQLINIAFICVVLLLSLSACGTLLSPGAPATQIYFSPSFINIAPAPEKTKKSMTVAYVQSSAKESGDDILLLINQRELVRYAGYRWGETVPSLFQRSIIAGIEAKQYYTFVVSENIGTETDFRLVCDLDQFVVRYPENEQTMPVAVLQARFRLIDSASGKILGTLPVLVEKIATGRDINSIASASENGVAEAMKQLTDWLIQKE